MSFLIDTHILIWYFENDKRLPPKVAEILEDASHNIYVSIASLWEIAIKLGLGKLTLTISFHEFQELLKKFLIEILPIVFNDTACYLSLPLHHRDPFDRILIAQAINHSLAIVSADADAAFDAYPVQRVWA